MRVYPYRERGVRESRDSPHVRHDYSILRGERPKGCVFQLVEAGTDFMRVQLAGNGEVWKGAGTAQHHDLGSLGATSLSAVVDVRPEVSELLRDEGCRLCRPGWRRCRQRRHW